MSDTQPALRNTFRDPAGTLRLENNRVLRTVTPDFSSFALGFLKHPQTIQWMAERRMVPTTVLDANPESTLLEHERILYPSYPWEWTPGQWVAAATLTLDMAEESLDQGLTLKDATPLNVLFDGPRAIFVDVLSFEPRQLDSPIWLAYGQFVRTFLLPLAAWKYLGWPLSASILRRDGYEPEELARHLGFLKRWSGPLRSLVALPTLFGGKNPQTSVKPGKSASSYHVHQSPEIAKMVLKGRLRKLRRMLNALAPSAQHSRWSDYPELAAHYSNVDHVQKQNFVQQALERIRPTQVLDLGANTGNYSRIAAAAGAHVVAWDTDIEAAERNWRQALAEKLPIDVMIADVARPTPAVGWRYGESSSLLSRAIGKFDCILVLGILHHMLLAEQVPLAEIAEHLAELTREWIVIEWVPQQDPRFQDLLRGREKLYSHLTEETFSAIFSRFFTVEASEQLANGRKLFLMKRK